MTAETTFLACLATPLQFVTHLPTLRLSITNAWYLTFPESKFQHFNCSSCTLTHRMSGIKLTTSPSSFLTMILGAILLNAV